MFCNGIQARLKLMQRTAYRCKYYYLLIYDINDYITHVCKLRREGSTVVVRTNFMMVTRVSTCTILYLSIIWKIENRAICSISSSYTMLTIMLMCHCVHAGIIWWCTNWSLPPTAVFFLLGSFWLRIALERCWKKVWRRLKSGTLHGIQARFSPTTMKAKSMLCCQHGKVGFAGI